MLNELQKSDTSRKNIAMRTRFVFQKLARKILAVAFLIFPGRSANTETKIADFELTGGADEYVACGDESEKWERVVRAAECKSAIPGLMSRCNKL